MDQSIEATVKAWQDNVGEADLAEELDALVAEDGDKHYDAFCRSLAFGTAGPGACASLWVGALQLDVDGPSRWRVCDVEREGFVRDLPASILALVEHFFKEPRFLD